MIPVKLGLQNFMSYGDKMSWIDFTSFHIACLSGGNGNGKSALLDAITWVLWGKARGLTRTNLDGLIRHGTNQMQVEFLFEMDNLLYHVVRKRVLGKGGAGKTILTLQVFEPEKQSPTSLTLERVQDTQLLINSILKIDYDVFINSCFIMQGRADEFTRKSPVERKAILSEILNLDVYELLSNRARERAGEAAMRLEAIEQRLEEGREVISERVRIEEEFSEEKNALKRLEQDRETVEERLVSLRHMESEARLKKSRLREIMEEIASCQDEIETSKVHREKIKERLEECMAVLQDEAKISAGYERLQILKEKDRELSERQARCMELERKVNELKYLIQERKHGLEQELKSKEERLGLEEERLVKLKEMVSRKGEIEDGYKRLLQLQTEGEELDRKFEKVHHLLMERGELERRRDEKLNKLNSERELLKKRIEEMHSQVVRFGELNKALKEAELELNELRRLAKEVDEIKLSGMRIRQEIEVGKTKMKLLRKMLDDALEKEKILSESAKCPLCERTLPLKEKDLILKRIRSEAEMIKAEIASREEDCFRQENDAERLRMAYKEKRSRIRDLEEAEKRFFELNQKVREKELLDREVAEERKRLEVLDQRISHEDFVKEETKRINEINRRVADIDYDSNRREEVRREIGLYRRYEGLWKEVTQSEFEIREIEGRILQLQKEREDVLQILEGESFMKDERRVLCEAEDELLRLDYQFDLHQATQQEKEKFLEYEDLKVRLDYAKTGVVVEEEKLRDVNAFILKKEEQVERLKEAAGVLDLEIEKLPQIEAEILKAEELLKEKRDKERTLKVNVGRLSERLERIREKEEEVASLESEQRRLSKAIRIYKALSQIYGKNGIQALMIENAIPEIESETNNILSRITDGELKARLETQRTKKKGGEIETLDIKISDSHGTRQYELFSGGEMFKINFALRIALSRLLTRRAGAKLRTLIIDEGFGSQDEKGLTRLIDVINKIRDDFEKILVVTHIGRLKDSFGNRIEVLRNEDGVSQICFH